MQDKPDAIFKCSYNKQALYVVCKNCTRPCFVNKIIKKSEGEK